MRPESTPDSRAPQKSEQDQIAEAQKSIGERVQFWEEQDKINQALIPRVIRQKERLDEHIENHEDLLEAATKAFQETLAKARTEQQSQHDAALEHYRKAQNRPCHVAWAATGLGVIALTVSVVALILSIL